MNVKYEDGERRSERSPGNWLQRTPVFAFIVVSFSIAYAFEKLANKAFKRAQR